jgi:lipopolysaccharide transport protein LptA
MRKNIQILRRHAGLLCLLPASLLLSPPGNAQINDLRTDVVIDAEQTSYDGKTSMLQFTGLRLTQGNIGIEADVAHASRMDFDDSVWQFSGNVVFDVDEGHVECDSADLKFANFELQLATIEGSPATFEFKRDGAEQTTFARANKLHYDVAAGVIEFSGDATITEGGNQISSESLVYDIKERRINAVATGDGSDRVKVIYTPPAGSAAPAAAEDNPDSAAEPPDAGSEDDGS